MTVALTARGLRCPYCQSNRHYVLDSRITRGGLRRRRVCQQCKERFSTMEQVIPDRYRKELPGPRCTGVQSED